MAYLSWMENNPKWLKAVLCIFYVDVTWMVYRIIKAVKAKNIGGIVVWALIAVFLGWIWWIVDLIFVLLNNKVLEF